MDDFLEQMGRVAAACGVIAKKSPPPRVKSSSPSTTESIQPSTKINSAVTCVYCKAKGHVKSECYKLRKKVQSANSKSSGATPSDVVSDTTRDNSSQVGCVVDNASPTLQISNLTIEITSMNGSKYSMLTLIDTGSPVSFMMCSVYKLFFGQESSFNKRLQIISLR